MSSPKTLSSSVPWFLIAVILLALSAALPVLADSHVRIVRLSYIEGEVQIMRAGAQSYEKAMVNLPIAEGMSLRTADNGRAEVEFEDGSTLRIVPGSVVEFPQLSLRDSGAKASEIKVINGTAYVNFAGPKGDEFVLHFGSEKIALTQAAHVRIDLNDKNRSLAVFKGSVQVDTPGIAEVKKGHTLIFGAADDQVKLAKSINEEPWDSWDDQQNEYHQRYAAKSYNSYSPYAYGTTDLAYYGSFFNYPGYGMMWQPYFVGAGWDPFMDGAWAYSPGMGYGWVSSYPWGWTPYHYGTWVFLSGRGWAWQPGGVWTTWSAQPVVVNAPKGYVPPRAPITAGRTIAVNRGTVSTFSGSKLVIRNNSAGLGVPRGQLENMSKLSGKVQEHGMVSQRVNVQPAAMQPRGMAPSAGQMGRAPEPRMGNVSPGQQPMPSMRQSAPPMRQSSPVGSSAGGGAGPHR